MPKFIVYRYSTDSIVVDAADEDEAIEVAKQAESGFTVGDTDWGVEEDN